MESRPFAVESRPFAVEAGLFLWKACPMLWTAGLMLWAAGLMLWKAALELDGTERLNGTLGMEQSKADDGPRLSYTATRYPSRRP